MKRMALLFAIPLLVCADRARATNITMTITGTISSGTDVTGMWGFPKNTSLAGQPFLLVFTFDDTKGVDSLNTDPSYIWSDHTSSSPGTAVLTINSHSYLIGAGSGPSSEAIIYTGFPYQSGGVNPGNYAYSASDGVSSVITSGSPSGSQTYMWGTWETDISTEAVTSASSDSFNINSSTDTSSGRLSPATLQVSGGTGRCLVAGALDTTTYPNILQDVDSTTFSATITPSSSQTVVTVDGYGYGSVYPDSFTTNTSGYGTGTYYGRYASGANLDTITEYACGGPATTPINVFDYNVSNFSIHQSNVSNATFTNSTDLGATGIETFLSGKGSFLANFSGSSEESVGKFRLGQLAK